MSELEFLLYLEDWVIFRKKQRPKHIYSWRGSFNNGLKAERNITHRGQEKQSSDPFFPIASPGLFIRVSPDSELCGFQCPPLIRLALLDLNRKDGCHRAYYHVNQKLPSPCSKDCAHCKNRSNYQIGSNWKWPLFSSPTQNIKNLSTVASLHHPEVSGSQPRGNFAL